jgi:hypothetical protein
VQHHRLNAWLEQQILAHAQIGNIIIQIAQEQTLFLDCAAENQELMFLLLSFAIKDFSNKDLKFWSRSNFRDQNSFFS